MDFTKFSEDQLEQFIDLCNLDNDDDFELARNALTELEAR